MKLANTRALHAYWDALRGDRAAPERAEIDPAAISGVINDVFVLEAIGDRQYPVRLAGSSLVALFLEDITGASLPDLFASDDAQSLIALLESVLDDPTAIVAGAAAIATGQASMDLELLLLPLRGPDTLPPRILGSLAMMSRQPWFGLIAPQPLQLSSLRILHSQINSVAAGPAAGNWSTLPLGHHGKPPKVPVRQANLTLYNG